MRRNPFIGLLALARLARADGERLLEATAADSLVEPKGPS